MLLKMSSIIHHIFHQSDPSLGHIVASYKPAINSNLENTSKSFQLHFYDPHFSSLTGGPLTGEYKVAIVTTVTLVTMLRCYDSYDDDC